MAAITLQQPIMFAVCLDVGGAYTGAMVGAMNMSSQLGGFIGSVAFGYIVGHTGNYNLPFIPMAALLFFGACMWLWIDPSRTTKPGHADESAHNDRRRLKRNLDGPPYTVVTTPA